MSQIDGFAEKPVKEGTTSDLSYYHFKRIAVMPFLKGKLESPDKPLGQALSTLIVDESNVKDDADRVMTKIIHDALRIKFPNLLLSLEGAEVVYRKLIKDQSLGTPRKVAKKLGEALSADLVVVGTVWRFRERGTIKEMPDSPSSVAFTVYLVDVATGKRLWRGTFDGTQKTLSEDVLGGLKQAKISLRWLSASELAGYGAKEVLRKLPLR